MQVYIDGRRVRLDPSRSIGKGGEADVFDAGGGFAIKVFKDERHPDLAGSKAEQRAAVRRIERHQKKLPAFPAGLPDRIVAPEKLVTDAKGRVIGYRMRLLTGAELLLRYAEPSFRKAGLPEEQVVGTFRDLHATLRQLHGRGVVIGDFNDLNVLVRDGRAFLIDTDSFQFGEWACEVFTERFVDPLLCNPSLERLSLARRFTPDSDWYAFAVMLMQSLLFVGPYGGIHKPKNASQRVAPSARPLKRITVFHPEVQYPKPARPLSILPDDLLHRFHRTFVEDQRGEFPEPLLEDLHFRKCLACGALHARSACLTCSRGAKAALKQTVRVNGRVSCETVFRTDGVLLHASAHGGRLGWLAWENGRFVREDGRVVLEGPLDPGMHFRLDGPRTLVARGGQLVVLAPDGAPERFGVDTCADVPAFETNGAGRFWIEGGRLLRNGRFGPERIGDVLAGQTRFWCGTRLGVGFYRAGALSVGFVFDPARTGLDDSVALPQMRGQLLDAACAIDGARAWLTVAVQEAGRRVNRCLQLDASGAVEAFAEADGEGDGWLASLHGSCAAGGGLLVATEGGLVRVEAVGRRLEVTREFPGTEAFVDSSRTLLAGAEGLWVVGENDIHLLKLV